MGKVGWVCCMERMEKVWCIMMGERENGLLKMEEVMRVV